VVTLPSGFGSKIKSIVGPRGEQADAIPPESVTILLEDDIDISRGDMIVRPNNQPEVTQNLDLMICWFDHAKSLQLNGKYAIRHSTQEARCVVKEIKYKLDIETLSRDQDNLEIKVNDIARVVLRTTKPLFIDTYSQNRITGSIILIDEATNNTVGVGMVI